MPEIINGLEHIFQTSFRLVVVCYIRIHFYGEVRRNCCVESGWDVYRYFNRT